ncbi:MAG: threonine synthase [Actinomycetota bacterium]
MAISYQSTRGDAPELDFGDVLLTGLASDGGLYCPSDVPSMPDLPADVADYAAVAAAVMAPYVEGSIDPDAFASIVADAYTGFRHPEVCPLVDLGDGHHLLDLTQGPTLAFKDFALQMVGRLMDHELERRDERLVVVMATSGDTGSAAIEALANRSRVGVVVLHPNERVSEVQRRQMTTVIAPNVVNLAVRGTFDDCQDLVKAAFATPGITGGPSRLGAVNSINWARVMSQIVYYVSAARRLTAAAGRPDSPVSFTVPTGNFGNILAGWYAKRMGLAVDQLVVASNRNDVLTRYMEQGELASATVVPSLSPSMDIQISSNFERLLWEAGDRDGAAVADLIATFRRDGRAPVHPDWTERIRREFDAARVDDSETVAEIARVYERTGVLIDPHTAVGTYVARMLRRDPDVPMVTLATAAPAKFADAVERGAGVRPELPPFLAELMDRPEHYEFVDADLDAVGDHLRAVGTVITTC